MTAESAPDPRPAFARALDQAGHQITAVRAEELDKPTPCAEYDVRALLGHIVAVLHKLARVGTGGDARDLPDVLDGIADDGWPTAFAEARNEVDRVWSDDARLDRATTLPWATLPGRDVLDAYTHEFTVHSWDLAHATGRLAALDPDLATRALAAFPKFAPPESRSEQGPFAPPLPTPTNATPYTQLATYLGRPT